MSIHFAFIFVTKDADSSSHRSVVETPSVKCTVVAVRDYAEAEEVSKKLVAQGVGAIELCGGFGHSGTARVAAAVAGKAHVGAIRFDTHPALNCKSPDDQFS
jgi:hypothetical protein